MDGWKGGERPNGCLTDDGETSWGGTVDLGVWAGNLGDQVDALSVSDAMDGTGPRQRVEYKTSGYKYSPV